MILFIGFGELAKSLITLVENEDLLYVLNRNPEKVRHYQLKEQRVRVAMKEDIPKATRVFILLPSNEYEPFFKEFGSLFNKKVVFYHFATAKKIEEVEEFITGKVIPCKCVGQANQMMKDNQGLFLVPEKYEKERKWLTNWFGSNVKVEVGSEEDAILANTLATETAIKMAVLLKKELEKEGLSTSVVNQSIEITTRGVIQSYMNNTLGGFGQKVLKEVERD
ncbi:NAD(P)-binding domain-containing protein [Bacillus sp. FJAT-45350]|uniref:NAD(P)-binding domain-containing protein n=1 Tax=Bacillus sp. FJAT-45350 TaxID=2011014 RepID=UPI000BB93313|nr:NAD(P)-binding domain-containing protein [Bacillus sp. FJAT-45350]